MDSPFGNSPASDYILVVLAIIVGARHPLFMYTTDLDTEVRESRVFIPFRPFHWKWVAFDCDNIQAAEATTYSPLRDYGGWGIRYVRRGKAYNISRNEGVLLTLNDGTNILIGSKNHELLCPVINGRILSI